MKVIASQHSQNIIRRYTLNCPFITRLSLDILKNLRHQCPDMPLPPPPPPPSFGTTARQARPSPPVVAAHGPPRALLLELVVYNGAPFKDHWAYFVRSSYNPSAGVMIHATGDVRNGFQLQIKRSYDFASTSTVPTSRTPLQWIDGRFLDEGAMLHNGNYKNDDRPVCGFEGSLCKIKVPEKSLNTTSQNVSEVPYVLACL